jgi:hypothetical protein
MRLPPGCSKIPWGFIEAKGVLVANSTFADRNRRAELGEFAISLLGRLGVSEEKLKTLISEADPIEALKRAP